MIPEQNLIIRKPFLVWVRRRELEKRLIESFVIEEKWKNPRNL